MSDLSPCPFCRGTASTVLLGGGMWQITCSKCRASTGLCDTEAEAIARWNARPGAVKSDPAPGTVRVVRRYEVWSNGEAHLTDSVRLVAPSGVCSHVVTVTADLPLPPAPVVVAGTVETS